MHMLVLVFARPIDIKRVELPQYAVWICLFILRFFNSTQRRKLPSSLRMRASMGIAQQTTTRYAQVNAARYLI